MKEAGILTSDLIFMALFQSSFGVRKNDPPSYHHHAYGTGSIDWSQL